MLNLEEDDLNRLLDYSELLENMRSALAAEGNRAIVTKPRVVLSTEPVWWGVMSAYHRQMGVCVKVVGVFPPSPKGPTVRSKVMLFDYMSGELLALMDGSYVTAVRTAIMTCLAMRSVNGGGSVYLIGAGTQAKAHALAMSRLFDLEKVNCVSKTDASGKRFRVWCDANGIPFDGNLTAENADVVVAATNSTSPVLQVYPEKAKIVCSVGAHTPDSREMGDQVMASAQAVLVDDLEACLSESGDLVQSLRKGLLDSSKIVPIADVVGSRFSLADRSRVVYKSVGSAYQDLVAANYFYSKAAGFNGR
ncbi:MAG: ornithine cyclodeaminase family protein [Thermoprotei archaeon]